MTTPIKVSDGPSKFALMMALFDRDGKPRAVAFKVAQESDLYFDVTVMGMEQAGPDDNWHIKGRCIGIKVNPRSNHGAPPPSRIVEVHYSTISRRGWIKFINE